MCVYLSVSLTINPSVCLPQWILSSRGHFQIQTGRDNSDKVATKSDEIL